jgi:hypothetical protein
VDPDLVLYGVDPYSKVVKADFQQENTIATLATLFGVLGLVPAAVGLYGVMAYTVEQRTSETGLRMALARTAEEWCGWYWRARSVLLAVAALLASAIPASRLKVAGTTDSG